MLQPIRFLQLPLLTRALYGETLSPKKGLAAHLSALPLLSILLRLLLQQAWYQEIYPPARVWRLQEQTFSSSPFPAITLARALPPLHPPALRYRSRPGAVMEAASLFLLRVAS